MGGGGAIRPPLLLCPHILRPLHPIIGRWPRTVVAVMSESVRVSIYELLQIHFNMCRTDRARLQLALVVIYGSYDVN